MAHVHLRQLGGDFKLRLEVPTVFGRATSFFHYPNHERVAPAVEARLEKLDYVQVEQDDFTVSRSHAVIYPDGPQGAAVRDLNSHNGVVVSGRKAARTPRGEGPPEPLQEGDVLQLGRLRLIVELLQELDEPTRQALYADRHALLAPSTAPEVAAMEQLLRERKRFHTADCVDVPALLSRLGALPRGRSSLGLIVLGLHATPHGDRLRLRGAEGGAPELALSTLLELLLPLTGSKVIVLQADADPRALEEAFLDRAHQDTILITSTVPSHSGVWQPLEHDMCSIPMDQVRRAGQGGLGPWHAALDGLDALIPLDSNVLDQSWVDGYQGALRVLVGTRLRDVYVSETSYSSRQREECPGTFRVRHTIRSRPEPRDGSRRDAEEGVIGSY